MMTPIPAKSLIYYAIHTSYLGLLLLARTEQGICSISLADAPDIMLTELIKRFPKATYLADDPYCLQLLDQLLNFLNNPSIPLNFNLDTGGTEFQQRVWHTLQKIPSGETLSYSEIAKLIGRPRAVRAVANACAANPIAIVIPCHRAIRADGQFSGYRWGSARKNALLQQESISKSSY